MATKNIIPQTVDDYCDLLESCQPFVQANYGDGEWFCILGYQGQNSQGGCYTVELRKALIETLKELRFNYWGWNPGKVETVLVNEAQQWRAANNGKIQWVKKEILAAANCQGELGSVFKALQKRKVLLIGPKHLRELEILKHNAFIEVPLPNAFTAIKDTVVAIDTQIMKTACDCLLFCSGMASNPTMWRLVPLLPSSVTMLDMGAIFDPYVGVLSRGAYRNMKSNFWQYGLKKNLHTMGLDHLLAEITAKANNT